MVNVEYNMGNVGGPGGGVNCEFPKCRGHKVYNYDALTLQRSGGGKSSARGAKTLSNEVVKVEGGYCEGGGWIL